MFRKQLTPSVVRRCAVFLTVGGAIGLGITQARAGLAPVAPDSASSADMAETGNVLPQFTQRTLLLSQEPGASGLLPNESAVASSSGPALIGPEDLTGPGITGGNWYRNLQVGVDQAFDPAKAVLSDDGASRTKSVARAANAPETGVKANAIPSLPSFWSGLTCCLAVMGAGMIPRVRRMFR